MSPYKTYTRLSPSSDRMRPTRRRFLYGCVLATATLGGCTRGTSPGSTDDGGGTATAVPEEPRTDEPPYPVADQPRDEAEWNELYLCENMPDDTDLGFDEAPAPRLSDPLLSGPHDGREEYAVRALTSAREVREVFDLDGDGNGESPEEPIDRIDFDSSVLLVVESGYGSGSIRHHWQRAEATDRGLRLHGCHVVPYVRTDDITARHSVVAVDRPPEFELARVSLTVDAGRRVQFNSTEGVVAVSPDG